LKVARVNVDNTDELLRLPSVVAEQKVARLTEGIAEQERQIILLSQRYRAKHPAMIAARTQRESLLAERNSVLKNVVALLESGREHLQAQYEEVKKAREEQEARLLAITGKSVEHNDLKRELETDSAMHQSVLARMKEIDVTKGLTDSPIRVHERASGAVPVGIGPAKVYGGAVFAGLLVGLGLILGLHFIDHSIQTVEQAEQVTGLPVLSAVPRKKKQRGQAEDRTLDAIIDRQGMIAESFRSLRASVAMLSNAETRRSFLFTSPLPSEGKTFCSANFAVILSQQGFRTLLIDADLRKPMISPVFFGEHRKPGLSEVLSGQIAVEEAIIATEIENLFVLTAGGRAPNPAELIATPRLREMIDEALTIYDRVVIDTAPVLAVSDTLLIAPYANVSCLVVRACSTSRKTAARAVRALTDIKCRPAGVILNFLPTGAGSQYYYSGKYYGSYSSKGVYGAKT
jgi:capsular exopolysaccharide synthesis family protein